MLRSCLETHADPTFGLFTCYESSNPKMFDVFRIHALFCVFAMHIRKNLLD